MLGHQKQVLAGEQVQVASQGRFGLFLGLQGVVEVHESKCGVRHLAGPGH